MAGETGRIGSVITVSGARVTGLMGNGGESELDRELAQKIQIGAMVAMRTSRSLAFGLVSSLNIPQPSAPLSPSDHRLMEIDLLGETMGLGEDGGLSFQRGVSTYPALGNPIYLTSPRQLGQIYSRPQKANVVVGSLHQEESLPAYVSIDDLIGNHFAILGTSGSGKSCAVAAILRAVLETHPQGHVILLDPHQEYPRAFGPLAEVVTPDDLNLPFWLLNFDEVTQVLCSSEPQEQAREAAILKDAILAAKMGHQQAAGVKASLTVDTPVPYRLEKLVDVLKTAMGSLGKAEGNLPYLRLLARLDSLRRDRRYAFLFRREGTQDIMGQVLGRLLRLPVDGKPITVFSLSGVPAEIIQAVVSLLCRLVFDFALWGREQPQVPMLLVCEEAHQYIPRDRELGFGPTVKAISRIAREGRKYGVSLGLVSQRPSEISESILSQCNTLFALRMSNEVDQNAIRSALPEGSTGLTAALPALRTQEAIVVGEGVTVPMRIRFHYLDEQVRPHSDTMRISQAWQEERGGQEMIQKVLETWRRNAGYGAPAGPGGGLGKGPASR